MVINVRMVLTKIVAIGVVNLMFMMRVIKLEQQEEHFVARN